MESFFCPRGAEVAAVVNDASFAAVKSDSVVLEVA